MKTTLKFDSQRAPGSVVVKTPDGRGLGVIVVIRQDSSGAPPTFRKGDRYFLNMGDSAYDGIPAGTYAEVKAAVVATYEKQTKT